jgi:hypothetical protein
VGLRPDQAKAHETLFQPMAGHGGSLPPQLPGKAQMDSVPGEPGLKARPRLRNNQSKKGLLEWLKWYAESGPEIQH